jgi:hypothetical protein
MLRSSGDSRSARSVSRSAQAGGQRDDGQAADRRGPEILPGAEVRAHGRDHELLRRLHLRVLTRHRGITGGPRSCGAADGAGRRCGVRQVVQQREHRDGVEIGRCGLDVLAMRPVPAGRATAPIQPRGGQGFDPASPILFPQASASAMAAASALSWVPTCRASCFCTATQSSAGPGGPSRRTWPSFRPWTPLPAGRRSGSASACGMRANGPRGPALATWPTSGSYRAHSRKWRCPGSRAPSSPGRRRRRPVSIPVSTHSPARCSSSTSEALAKRPALTSISRWLSMSARSRTSPARRSKGRRSSHAPASLRTSPSNELTCPHGTSTSRPPTLATPPSTSASSGPRSRTITSQTCTGDPPSGGDRALEQLRQAKRAHVISLRRGRHRGHERASHLRPLCPDAAGVTAGPVSTARSRAACGRWLFAPPPPDSATAIRGPSCRTPRAARSARTQPCLRRRGLSAISAGSTTERYRKPLLVMAPHG